MGARAWLVDMGRRHRARGTAGRDTSRPTARRQTGPAGVVGLESRQVSKPREGDDREVTKTKEGWKENVGRKIRWK